MSAASVPSKLPAHGRYANGTDFNNLLLQTSIENLASGGVTTSTVDQSVPPTITGLTLSSEVARDALGRDVAIVTATWNALVPDTSEAGDVDVSPVRDYWVSWAKSGSGYSQEAATTANTTTFIVPVGLTVTVRVRARTAAGVYGPYTTGTIAAGLDTTPPPQPSNPTVTAVTKGVRVKWDGAFAAGAAQPSDFDYVQVQYFTGPTNDTGWIPAGRLGGAGELTVVTTGLSDVTVRLVAYDYSRNASTPSGTATVASAPVFNGDIFALAIDTGKLADLAVATGKIGQNAVIGDKIATDAIVARHITAGAITTAKLTVAAMGDNLVTNADFSEPAATGYTLSGKWINNEGTVPQGSGAGFWYLEPTNTYWKTGGKNHIVVAHATAGDYAAFLNDQEFPVAPGQSFYAAAKVASNRNTRWYIRVHFYNSAGGLLGSVDPVGNAIQPGGSSTNSTVIDGRFTPPEGAATARIQIYAYTGDSGGYSVFNGAFVARVTVSAHIADGAITSDRIAANAITANHIATGQITADKIEASAINGKVIVGATFKTASGGAKVEISSAHANSIYFDTQHVSPNAAYQDLVPRIESGTYYPNSGGLNVDWGYEANMQTALSIRSGSMYHVLRESTIILYGAAEDNSQEMFIRSDSDRFEFHGVRQQVYHNDSPLGGNVNAWNVTGFRITPRNKSSVHLMLQHTSHPSLVGNAHIDTNEGRVYVNWFGGSGHFAVGNGYQGRGEIICATLGYTALRNDSSVHVKKQVRAVTTELLPTGLGMAMGKLRAMKAVAFKYDPDKIPGADDKVRLSFLAEDVETLLPEAVEYGVDGEVGLNTHTLLVFAMQALKEVITELDVVKAKLSKLPTPA